MSLDKEHENAFFDWAASQFSVGVCEVQKVCGGSGRGFFYLRLSCPRCDAAAVPYEHKRSAVKTACGECAYTLVRQRGHRVTCATCGWIGSSQRLAPVAQIVSEEYFRIDTVPTPEHYMTNQDDDDEDDE